MSSFTWVPIYTELADAILPYRNRQAELIGYLASFRAEGLKVFSLDDRHSDGSKVPLRVIDPFSFFASFNRNTRPETRIGVLAKLKTIFSLKSSVPEDFSGIPITDNQNTFFFAFEPQRGEKDISLLWDIAERVRSGGPESLPEKLFDECLNIRQIGPAKLTMGFFWMNPDKYLTVDSVMKKYLKNRGITVPAIETINDYLELLRTVRENVGTDFKVISYDAWKATGEKPPQPETEKSDKKYWAGGFLWGGEEPKSKLEEFIKGDCWQIGWPKDDPNEAAKDTWKTFDRISIGDEFAIKGIGGRHDLSIHYVGEVTEIESAEGKLRFRRLDRPLYKGKGPAGPGSGNWRLTLVPVTSQPLINLLFHGKKSDAEAVNAPVVTANHYTIDMALDGLFFERTELEGILNTWRAKKNIILQGPPGVGKSFVARRLGKALLGQDDPDRLRMIQFHQSMSYEDFIQGWRPADNGGFALKNGVFYEFCRRAMKDEADGAPYVFIIDEINRGNLSKILGEMMMLIEGDKRGEEFALPLTYSQSPGDTFYIPSNLHVLGLMNTADRSLALVDYALRRRFRFFNLEPKFDSPRFKEYLAKCGVSDELIGRIRSNLGALNAEIAKDIRNLGRGYQVGHSYFCPSQAGNYGNDWYEEVIRTEVLPLLDEYWFDQVDTVKGWTGRLLK